MRSSGAKNDGAGRRYVKDVADMLQRKVEVWGMEDMIIGSKERNTFTKSCSSKYDYGVHPMRLERIEEESDRTF